jgi:hypothetical protein
MRFSVPGITSDRTCRSEATRRHNASHPLVCVMVLSSGLGLAGCSTTTLRTYDQSSSMVFQVAPAAAFMAGLEYAAAEQTTNGLTFYNSKNLKDRVTMLTIKIGPSSFGKTEVTITSTYRGYDRRVARHIGELLAERIVPKRGERPENYR